MMVVGDSSQAKIFRKDSHCRSPSSSGGLPGLLLLRERWRRLLSRGRGDDEVVLPGLLVGLHGRCLELELLVWDVTLAVVVRYCCGVGGDDGYDGGRGGHRSDCSSSRELEGGRATAALSFCGSFAPLCLMGSKKAKRRTPLHSSSVSPLFSCCNNDCSRFVHPLSGGDISVEKWMKRCPFYCSG